MITSDDLNIVTGAFSFTGKYITRRLLSLGQKVKTLTGHPNRRHQFGDRVSVAPLNFDSPDELAKSLEGASTLYNTYWVRFPQGQVTFAKAVENTKTLIRAAERAGVRRIVHTSVTNASEASSLPYFRGKGLVEQAILHSRLSYAILRPTVIFGEEDILINNIAWLLRRFPLFAVPGSGDCRLQPVFVGDVAEIAVNAGRQKENLAEDAVGPETYSFDELIRLIAETIGRKARIVHISAAAALFLCKLIGWWVSDVVLTRDEVEGLMSNLLVSSHPPTGGTRLSEWLRQNANRFGTRYACELERHYR